MSVNTVLNLSWTCIHLWFSSFVMFKLISLLKADFWSKNGRVQEALRLFLRITGSQQKYVQHFRKKSRPLEINMPTAGPRWYRTLDLCLCTWLHTFIWCRVCCVPHVICTFACIGPTFSFSLQSLLAPIHPESAFYLPLGFCNCWCKNKIYFRIKHAILIY